MISEELLYSAAVHASDIYTAQLEVGYNREEEHQFTPKFEKKMRCLCRQARRSPGMNRFLRGLKTSAAVILIAATVFFSSLMTVEAYREKLIEVVTQVFEELTEYRFTSTSDAPGAQDVTFGYVPEGMEETSHEVDFEFGYIEVLYEGENGRDIELDAYLSDTDTVSTMILDTEDAEVTYRQIQGEKATCISKPPMATIMWVKGNSIFCLSGNLSMDETLRVAEGLHIS